MGLGSNRLLRLGGMAWWVELLLFSLLLVVIGGGMLWPEAAEAARTKHYKWTVDYKFWAPDCVEKLIISINGQYPGPTIRARVGDLVVVELQNIMPTETVLLHWHGILQVTDSCLIIIIIYTSLVSRDSPNPLFRSQKPF